MFRGFLTKGSLEAHEFGKHGITVNAYAPGMTDTQMSQSSLYIYLSTFVLDKRLYQLMGSFLSNLAPSSSQSVRVL